MKAPRKKRKPSDKRISLAPLTFEEALEALLKTPPPKKELAHVDEEHSPAEDGASERPAS